MRSLDAMALERSTMGFDWHRKVRMPGEREYYRIRQKVARRERRDPGERERKGKQKSESEREREREREREKQNRRAERSQRK